MNVKYNVVMKTMYKLNKAQIIESCGITEGKYTDFQFETGLEWIKENLWNDEAIIVIISSSPVFWDWFLNQWNHRDDDFIIDNLNIILNNDPNCELLSKWYQVHEVKNLNQFPQGKKWDRLVTHVIKNAGKEVVNA